MFTITYIGHHGWLIESFDGSVTSRVLVDPLLTKGFGNMPKPGALVYPPRTVDMAAFPALDAVVFTHEHPDHFSLESVRHLSEGIPLFLSSRSSTAARDVLKHLNRDVTLLVSGQTHRIGGLELTGLATPGLVRDEWDVMPYVVTDQKRHGSFVSSVDAPETIQTAVKAQCLIGGPASAWYYSHSHIDLFANAFDQCASNPLEALNGWVENFANGYREQFRQGELAPALLMLGWAGFQFPDDVAWLNAHAFAAAPEHIQQNLSERLPNQAMVAPIPGNSEHFKHGQHVGSSNAEFVTTPPKNQWPAHGAAPYRDPLPDYPPATGRTQLSPAERRDLFDLLGEFARYLYGGPIFRGLLTLDEGDIGHRLPQFAFSLREEDRPSQLAVYDPQGCCFHAVEGEDAVDRYVIGLECWASDLLALLRIELVAGYLLLGRVRTWNQSDGAIEASMEDALFGYAHPLRHPGRYLRLYLRTLKELAPIHDGRIAHNHASVR